MYAGTFSGGGRPYSLGESPLEQYTEAYGQSPYLGESFLEKLQGIAQKVGVVAGELEDVRAGRTKVATVSADSPSVVFPGPKGVPVGFSIPWWGFPVAAAGIWFLARGTKRRR